jgi:hypothetical protein
LFKGQCEAHREFLEHPTSNYPLQSAGSELEPRPRSLACQGFLGAIAGARTTESPLDSRRQPFLV